MSHFQSLKAKSQLTVCVHSHASLPRTHKKGAVRLLARWRVGPSTSQELTKFVLPATWERDGIAMPGQRYGDSRTKFYPMESMLTTESLCDFAANSLKATSVSPSRRMEMVNGSEDAVSKGSGLAQQSVPPAGSWWWWPHTLAATYPTVIGSITTHTYKVTKREPCQS